jgi:hypothetical protein
VGQTWKSDKHGFTPPHLPVFLCFACIGTPSHLLVFCVLYAEPQCILQAQMLGTAVRALTDPASLSKDASVSNEDLQEIALEAQVNSLFDGSSDSDSECVQRPVVLAPGNTKDQQNEQPKAGCSSGTSSLCPLDLIDEDIDHNQNDSEEEQIDEVGSPSPASSALKRFGSASNQQIRGNLEQAVTRMYAECELEKESGHAQQVWRYTTRRKGDISPAHKAARCAVLDAMCSRGCLLRCELSKIYQLSFKTYMADRLAENIELERCPQTCPDGSMSRVLPKLMTAFGFVRVDVFLPDGKQLRKHHLYFIDSPSLTDSLLLQMAEAQQRALTLASEMAKITGTAYMDIRCSISSEARPILDRVIVATGSALGLSASGISDRFGLSVRQQYASTRMFASLLDNIEDARSVATKTVAAKVIKKTNAGVKHVGKAVAYQIAKEVKARGLLHSFSQALKAAGKDKSYTIEGLAQFLQQVALNMSGELKDKDAPIAWIIMTRAVRGYVLKVLRAQGYI